MKKLSKSEQARLDPMELGILAVKKYTIEVIHYKNGANRIIRTNAGILAHELLGMLTLAVSDVIEQIKNRTLPADELVIGKKKYKLEK